jgi:hypothetical protein
VNVSFALNWDFEEKVRGGGFQQVHCNLNRP